MKTSNICSHKHAHTAFKEVQYFDIHSNASSFHTCLLVRLIYTKFAGITISGALCIVIDHSIANWLCMCM